MPVSSRVVHTVVLRTAGVNCDIETAYAFEKAGARVTRLHINRLVEAPARLDRFHILALPGGFSYGDDIASGKLLANEIRYRLGEAVARFVAQGKLVLGICNGFQVLVKSGLLPGPLNGLRPAKARRAAPGLDAAPTATLTLNDSARFEDRWVHLAVESDRCVFVTPEDGPMMLPVAHGEGKFVAAPRVLDALERDRRVVFRYVDPSGNAEAAYPWNPNGAARGIAGICDATGRILGLMPHPERHVAPTQHPRWTREGLAPQGHGFALFRNAVAFARAELL